MQNKKIIIVHDTFLYKGGGERLILMMAKTLGADLASGFFSKGSFDLRKEGFKGKIIPVSTEIFKKGFRHIRLKKDFLYNTKFLKDYDVVIFSGDCLAAVRNCRKDAKKIYYCHTPPRYLYDLKQEYLKKVPFLLKPAFNLISAVFRKMYESDIKKIDLILTNSKNTQNRLKKFIGYNSEVLYPPVKLEEFKWISQGDYYLSFARLADAKRVDNIVKAFLKMPDKKLVVVYGENDPQRQKIFELAKNAKNISFKTFPGNQDFYECVGKSIATIYIPIDEDFGMSPVESMAAGKPVLGVNEGGLKESIIHKKTGYLIPAGGNPEDIIDAISNFLTPEKCLEMKKDCEARAKNFSFNNFEKQLKSYI